MTFKVKTKGQNEGEKLLKPKLRFKEFNDNWTLISLNSLMEFKNGINAAKNAYGKGIKYISVTDILNNNFITYEKIKGLVNIDNITLKNNSVTYGDVVFQRSSETIEDIGRANVYLDHNKVATFGGFVIRGKKKGDYNPLFINYLLQNSSSRKTIIVKGAGAQHYNISQEELEKIELYFPSIQEQEKIANLLSLLDKKIELQKSKIETLKIYKRGLIQKLYDQKYNNKIKMKNIIKQKSIRNKNNEIKDIYSVNNKDGFILQSDQFKDRIVASEDTTNYKIIKKDYFAYNPARINVGSIARMKYKKIGIISPMYICFECKNNVLPEYLEYFFETDIFTYEMKKRLEGSVRMCLSYESMLNIPIDLPDIMQQEMISKVLNEFDKRINCEEIKYHYQKKLKDGLLQKMFI